MRRREFITLIGGAAAAWPVVARAQQPKMPVIGVLNSASADLKASIAAFREGLADSGFVEGRNVAIEFRWANGDYDRLPTLAADLARRQVTVILTGGGVQTGLAAKTATNTIPIVFTGGSDPVAAGLVASLSRPGGNVTGVLNIASELTTKRFEILRELVPGAKVVGVLRNPGYSEGALQVQEVEAAGSRMGVNIFVAAARLEDDFEYAIASLTRQGVDAVFVANDPYFASKSSRLAALITRARLPAIYAQRQYTEAGGLMSYGTNFADIYRQAGVYVGRILKGERPAELPVLLPSKFELVINRKTLRALGLELPTKLLALADEVLE